MAIKLTGTFQGKSNKLGYGGRAAQLEAQGVPGGVIGNLARAAGAAPGGPNYHGGKPGKKKMSDKMKSAYKRGKISDSAANKAGYDPDAE